MNYDEYWERLVDRVHRGKETLHGDEDVFRRLTMIRRETHIGGIQTYFDERFSEFEEDMQALEAVGLHHIAAVYRRARTLLYGDALLTAATVFAWLDRDDADEEPSGLAEVRNEVWPLLDELEDVTDRFGLKAGFYDSL
jgi:hypothetical protein